MISLTSCIFLKLFFRPRRLKKISTISASLLFRFRITLKETMSTNRNIVCRAA